MSEVWEEKSVPWRLGVRNQTGASIEIRDFVTSCGCMVVEPRQLTIPAGETATLELTFDLTHRLLSEAGQDQRPFEVAISPILAHGSIRGHAWRVHGVIKSRVTLDSPTVHFGERPILGHPPVVRKVRATVHIPNEGLEVIVDPKAATVV